MNRKPKSVPTYILIIAVAFGSVVRFFPPQYQLIFLGGVSITLVYEILKLKRQDAEEDKEKIIIAALIFGLLMGLLVIGKNYIGISDSGQLIILAVAFIELILALTIFGYRIVIKSGDSNRIRQFVIPAIMLYVILAIFGLFILYNSIHK
ncbi:hypothetical protein [Clostridium sp. YIM B02551]|uniref:hypothetical protein n=1 Tax=Clostridium sp. YIM B02551 TaxID=2910679 RepID=UPI001EECDB0F|nr:hypothetical protein [Clostridium sp. YIM B02551]